MFFNKYNKEEAKKYIGRTVKVWSNDTNTFEATFKYVRDCFKYFVVDVNSLNLITDVKKPMISQHDCFEFMIVPDIIDKKGNYLLEF